MFRVFGLLIGHFAIHQLMFESAEAADCAQREISLVNTLTILRCRLPEVPRSLCGLQLWYDDLIAEIAEERVEPRRNRINPRVIQRKMSNWAKKRHKHRNSPQPTRTFGSSIAILN